MSTFGIQAQTQIGGVLQVAATGCARRPSGGVTVDWSLVTAAAADTTLPDGTVIKSGEKYLRYGQVLAAVTQAEVQTVTISGSPTGGTFTITANSATTSGIAYNATAATVQTAIRGLVGNYSAVTVTGSAGGPYTVTFPANVYNVAQMTASGAGLTGGSSPSVAVATTTSGVTNAGKYGPYDSSATDGRQTLSRGTTVIVNTTIKQNTVGVATDYPDVITGGIVWKERLLAGTTGNPSFSSLETALPSLDYVQPSAGV